MDNKTESKTILKTTLYDEHLSLNAKMFEFGDYLMPIRYESSLREQEWVREHVGIFDVSHMGQLIISGKHVVDFLMLLTPSDFCKTPIGRAKYTVLLNTEGGILDDLIVTRIGKEEFLLVVNASRKNNDIAWIKSNISRYNNSRNENTDGTSQIKLIMLDDKSLIAVQGRESCAILSDIFAESLDNLPYMMMRKANWQGHDLLVSRVGYTGEDGFEISVNNDMAVNLWRRLLQDPQIKPIGLTARDGLRLEAGYPLFGNDIDESTSPIEANISWVVSKNNNKFYGNERVLKEKISGTSRKRVSIKLSGRALAKKDYRIYDNNQKLIGKITSGAFSPLINCAIAQGYVHETQANAEQNIFVEIRNQNVEATIHNLSFITPRTISSKAVK